MRILHILILMLSVSSLYTQPNCEAFRYLDKDTIKYLACIKTQKIEGHYQFSKAYQNILDEAIKIDPTFDYAYRRKSTAYLKSGDFISWKELMDKAVKYNPQDNLEYRALMRYKCFGDYKGALRDFKKMDSLGLRTDYLAVAKAMCYKSIGDKDEAVQILEKHVNEDDDFFLGLHDYLHLGVLYLNQNKFQKALNVFQKQSQVNEIAENQFYLALTYKALQKPTEYRQHLREAKSLYLSDNRLFDTYIDLIDKIYLSDIENEMEEALQNTIATPLKS